MRRFFVGLAILAIAVQVPLTGRAGDRQIAQKIVQILESEKSKGNLRNFNIGLHVDEGSVYLTGHVADREQERIALKAARQAEGVEQVFNEIEIRKIKTSSPPKEQPAKPSPQPAEIQAAEVSVPEETVEESPTASTGVLEQLTEAVQGALDSVQRPSQPQEAVALIEADAQEPTIQTVSTTSRETIQTVSTASQDSLADARRIATEIIDQFREEKQKGNLRRFGIDVEVDHGVVWLKGHVASHEHQQLALEIARHVPGVKRVVNDLTIKGIRSETVAASPSRHDDAIAKEVVDLLQQHKQRGNLRDFGVDVQVEQGTVWLSGYVADQQQQDLVLDAARYVSGVKQVVNDLTTEDQYLAAQADGYSPVPHAAPAATQTPLAFAPAQAVNHQSGLGMGTPVPMSGAAGGGIAAARYDHPQMPGYAWPSYAPHPNYGAVTYPKQHSAAAWPYIGPFYPYPQVPLGWRKVTLEWDDGWWHLDFKDRHRR